MDHFETFVIKFFVWNFLQFEQVSLIFKIFAKCTVNILKTSFHCTVNCTYYAVVQFVHVMYLYSRIYTLYSCNVYTLVLWSTFYVSVQVTFKVNTHICLLQRDFFILLRPDQLRDFSNIFSYKDIKDTRPIFYRHQKHWKGRFSSFV